MSAPGPEPAAGPRPRFTPGWCLRMAWRDSRRSRRQLLLFSASIVLGIAAMVAIGSLGRNLERAVEEQSKALLGADLMVQARDPFDAEQREFLDRVGDAHSDQVFFSSMVFFPKGQGTRLAQVVGMSGAFPFYGEVETEPAEAWARFKAGEGALVEESLLAQFGARAGDEVKVGRLTVRVAGALRKVPGDNEIFASFAPRVLLPLEQLAATGLLGEASLARYRRYVRFDSEAALQAAVRELNDRRDRLRLRVDTVEERRDNLGESMANLHRYLNLVGFVALLLGGIGIASAIQVHVRQRLDSVAVLRCLGATSGQAFAIYLIQGAALGLAGALAGTVLGVGLQQFLPRVLSGLIPMALAPVLEPLPVLRAAAAGLGICLLFALLPLLQVRTVPPLAVFRREVDHLPRRDPWLVLAGLGVAAAVVAFALAQTKDWRHGLGFAGGLAVACLLLAGVARGAVWAVRRITRPSWPFAWRQGLASLHRPQNRTLLLTVSLGLGTFLIVTLHLVQHALVRELNPDAGGPKPNVVLFDVQADQRADVLGVLTNQQRPVLDVSPVVTMRIRAVKGVAAADLIQNRTREDRWALRREYRSTYREELASTERLVAGTLVPRVAADTAVVPVSLEEGIARDLGVTLGDEIEFDVQGLPVRTRVASLRHVDWRRLQANFFVVFPVGVLEEAPGFYIVTTRVPDGAASAELQRTVVRRHPNVSIVDFTLVLRVVEGVVGRVSFAIQFMALFTVVTGVLLLVTAVLNSRFQRLRETILLRTLGASAGQLVRIQVAEFLLLGLLASFTGLALAVGAQWALTHFVFKVGFSVPAWHLVAVVAANCALTVGVGLLAGRAVRRRPPLEVLRAEA